MARLSIRSVRYEGKNWVYQSPPLSDGLQILIGDNGAGKTTFSNLLYFGLGGKVAIFDRNAKKKHSEIVSDENNSVLVQIELAGGIFQIKRFFGAKDILVTGADGQVEIFPVNRSPDKPYIFSDWLLEKFDITAVKLHSGTYSGKINFKDLMRLIYHDQALDPSSIYKLSLIHI